MDVMPQNREENLLIVCTVPNLQVHDKVNMAVLRVLGAEVLQPAKQDQLAHRLAATASKTEWWLLNSWPESRP